MRRDMVSSPYISLWKKYSSSNEEIARMVFHEGSYPELELKCINRRKASVESKEHQALSSAELHILSSPPRSP
jgi:hypothetical protein